MSRLIGRLSVTSEAFFSSKQEQVNEEERQSEHDDPGEQAQGQAEGETPPTARAGDGLSRDISYRRWGSIEIEAGRSLPTKIGRSTCD